MAAGLSSSFSELSLEPASLSREQKAQFNDFVKAGKAFQKVGRLQKALDAFQNAFDVSADPKLGHKIDRLEEMIEDDNSESSNESNNEEEIIIDDKFRVNGTLYENLYGYQREGLRWLYGQAKAGRGGILGDDMGLGKTIQIIAFVRSMLECELLEAVLIVMPKSLIANWEKEFEKWAPDVSVDVFHGDKGRRKKMLGKIGKFGGVCLITYGMTATSCDDLLQIHWDSVILDEGHQIKNKSTKMSKAVHEIPAKLRFILSGTPIQNNLMEFWTLMNFIETGIFGTQANFKRSFDRPITKAREKDAMASAKRYGQSMAEELQRYVKPYIFRRTKKEVLGNDVIGLKTDLVIWLHLSQTQIRLYNEFNERDDIKDLMSSSKKNPLVYLNVLKKLCDHPRLASGSICSQLGLDDEADGDNESDSELPSPAVLMEESGKVQFVAELMDYLRKQGNRTLIFSQSLVMLDILEKVLSDQGHMLLRVDGKVSNVSERMKRIEKFETDPQYSGLLLSTKIGCLGLNLTAADRAIIVDPSWNPTVDAQAIDRIYRIGQKKDVIVYRLITCGSVEEKIFRRQVFKDSLFKQTVGASKDPTRYFTNQELRDLLVLSDPQFSATQRQLEELHGTIVPEPLGTLGIFGTTDHVKLFTVDTEKQENEAPDEEWVRTKVLQEKQRLIESQTQMQPLRVGHKQPSLGDPLKQLPLSVSEKTGQFEDAEKTPVELTGIPSVSNTTSDPEESVLHDTVSDKMSLAMAEAKHMGFEQLVELGDECLGKGDRAGAWKYYGFAFEVNSSKEIQLKLLCLAETEPENQLPENIPETIVIG